MGRLLPAHVRLASETSHQFLGFCVSSFFDLWGSSCSEKYSHFGGGISTSSSIFFKKTCVKCFVKTLNDSFGLPVRHVFPFTSRYWYYFRLFSFFIALNILQLPFSNFWNSSGFPCFLWDFVFLPLFFFLIDFSSFSLFLSYIVLVYICSFLWYKDRYVTCSLLFQHEFFVNPVVFSAGLFLIFAVFFLKFWLFVCLLSVAVVFESFLVI